MGRGTGSTSLDTFDFSDVVRGNVLEDEWNDEAIQHVLTGFDRYFSTGSNYIRGKVWPDIAQHRKYLPYLKARRPDRWEQLITDLALYNIPGSGRERDIHAWVSGRVDATRFRRTRSLHIVNVKGGRGKGSQSRHLRLDAEAETSLCGLPLNPAPGTFESLASGRCKKCQEKLEKLLASGSPVADELAGLTDDRNCKALPDQAVDHAISRAKEAVGEKLLLAGDLTGDPERLQAEITELGDREFRRTIAEQAVAHLYELGPDDRLLRLTFNGFKPNHLDALRSTIKRTYGSPCPWPSEEEMVRVLDGIMENGLWSQNQQGLLAHLTARLFPDAIRELTATLNSMPFETTMERVWRDDYPDLLSAHPDGSSKLLPI
jgi:hypothetical protein